MSLTLSGDGSITGLTSSGVASSSVGYLPAGTGAVATTVQTKLRESVSVFDFMTAAQIADVQAGTASLDVTTAVQAALNASSVVYIPKGTYAISSAINIPSQRRMYGDGMDRTTIKATASGARITNAVTRHDNIRLEGFTFDGNNVAIVGITLGVAGSIGVLATSSSDSFIEVKVAQCTNTGIVLNCNQYSTFDNCIISSNTGGYGLYINECGPIVLTDVLFTSNETALFIGGDQAGTNPGGFSSSSIITLINCSFYGPYSAPAEGYVVLRNAYNINFQGCYFEHEITHSQPLIRIERDGASNITGNIYFNECSWYGIAYNTDLISITYGRRVYFTNCTAIPQNSGYYIVKSTDSTAQIILENCTANTAGYSTFATVFWGDSASYVNAVSGTVTSINFPNAYQTGTWNATLTDGTNNATMGAFTCNFVKIGRQVTVSGNISTSSLGSVTGNISIAGLPYAISGFAAGSVGYATNLSITSGQSLTLLANNSGSSITPYVWNAANGTTRMTAAQWGATGNIAFTMTYTTTA